MSLIGRKPINVPSGATVVINGTHIVVKGPKGQLENDFDSRISVEQEDNTVRVTRSGDEPKVRALHGLWRSLISNMVVGVTDGFQKKLEIVGTGYRVKKSGKGVELTLGFSHTVKVEPFGSNELVVEGNNALIVKGISREQVGEQAARIRKLRKPNPYTGKGVKYADEQIRRKQGKTGAAATA